MTFCSTNMVLIPRFYSVKSKKNRRKRSRIVFLLISLICVYFTCYPQKKHHVSEVKKDTLEQVKIFSGQLTGWAVNEDYVYNGFYLQTGCAKYLVVFYPHMGKKLRQRLQTNSTISINGVETTSSSNENVIKLISIQDDDDVSVYDTPPSSETKETEGKFITGSSKVNEIQKDHHNKYRGVVLDNQIILHMPSSYLKKIKKIAPVGTNIFYTGEKQVLAPGEVALMDYTVIHCNTLTINGKQYLIR